MSAAKRVAKTAVDWAKFSSLVPKEEAGVFAALKGKSDAYAIKVAALPEALPKLDFAHYKQAVPAFASTIDEFAKSYGGVSVPYPGDQGKLGEIEAAAKEQATGNAAWIAESAARVQNYTAELAKWEIVPPLEHMVEEEWNYYFPGTIKDSKEAGYYLELADDSQQDYRLFEYQNNYGFKMAPWQGH